MMNILYNLCIASNVAVMTFVGMLSVWVSFLPDVFTPTPTQLALMGLSLLFLSFLTTYLDKNLKKEDESITIPTPKGKINITKFALEEFLKKEALDQKGIKSAKPRLKISRGKISIFIKIEINAIAKAIPEIVENLQLSIEELLKDKMGILTIAKIEVQVAKIIKEEDARIIQLK